jgi:uncharacterized protein
MKQTDVVLAAMAAGTGAIHSPVQMQKLLFLIDKRISKSMGGAHFNFQPYHYGPYDPAIFSLLEVLEAKGLVTIHRQPDRRWKSYQLTSAGQATGDKLLNDLGVKIGDYVRSLSSYVRSRTFAELVSAIYDAYPDMKANSVFAG